MKIKFQYVAILVGIAFVFSLVITAGDATILDKLGIQGYYSQIEEFIPFALTPSDKLSCELVQSIYFIDANSNKRILSSFKVEEFIPSTKLDLTARSGTYTIKTLEGDLKADCPSSATLDPIVSGGVITFQLFGTNSKGETVKIMDAPYTTLSTASVDGKQTTLAKWSISAAEIESKVGKSSSVYTTTITSNAIGTINLKEKPTSSQIWSYSIKHGVTSASQYKVVPTPTNNPIGDAFSGLAKRKVELKLVNADNAILDLRKNNPAIISLIGSLYDWEEQVESYPVLKLYYTDPQNSIPSEAVTPKITKTLTTYKGKAGIGNVADFIYGLNLGNNPKLGEYKITFSSALKDGKPIRDIVASITFKIIKSTATCEETKTCPDTTPDSSSNLEPDANPLNDYDKISECLKTGNIQCILTNSGIPINIISGLVVFVVLIIIIAIIVAVAKRPPKPLPRY